MRLSIKQGDPGYRPPTECQRFRVFFNDVERFDVHTADEEKGYIIPVIYRQTAPWLPTRMIIRPTLRGKVEIKSR